MKTRQQRVGLALGLWAVAGWLGIQAPAQQITGLDFVPRLTIQSEIGITNQIQYTNNLSPSNWTVLATVVVTQSPYTYLDLSAPPAPQRFYRVVVPSASTNPPAPAGMVWIPGGTFVMGSSVREVERIDDEVQHTVTVSGFYMNRHEVTQGEYLAVVGNNPSWFNGNRTAQGYTNYGTDLSRPVEQVSWYDATNYCHLRNLQEERLGSGWEYRLPTESEWEYACRAGTSTPFHYGSNLLSGMADFDGRLEYIGGVGSRQKANGVHLERTTAVGSYQPNALGLYDMHGNVWEWCWDWYDIYPEASVVNPVGPGTGSSRVVRGGGWDLSGSYCRSAIRGQVYPNDKYNDTGFRVILAPGQ